MNRFIVVNDCNIATLHYCAMVQWCNGVLVQLCNGCSWGSFGSCWIFDSCSSYGSEDSCWLAVLGRILILYVTGGHLPRWAVVASVQLLWLLVIAGGQLLCGAVIGWLDVVWSVFGWADVGIS